VTPASRYGEQRRDDDRKPDKHDDCAGDVSPDDGSHPPFIRVIRGNQSENETADQKGMAPPESCEKRIAGSHKVNGKVRE